MNDGLRKVIGLKLKEAMGILEKFSDQGYVFEVTKDPRQESSKITEEFRILRVKKLDNGLLKVLVCI